MRWGCYFNAQPCFPNSRVVYARKTCFKGDFVQPRTARAGERSGSIAIGVCRQRVELKATSFVWSEAGYLHTHQERVKAN